MEVIAHVRSYRWFYISAFVLIGAMLLVAFSFKRRFGQYFDIAEFDSPDSPGSGSSMQKSTLKMLLKARERAGIPFLINSAFRSGKHNRDVGGVENSAHERGYAVDIKATDRETKLKILASLYEAGFNRFGIGTTFIHADNDPAKAAFQVWDYGTDISYYVNFLKSENSRFV